MCGPLVVAYSLHLRSEDLTRPPEIRAIYSRGFFHHIVFHGGRVATYTFLGGLAALLANVSSFHQVLGNLRGGFTFGAGILMVLLGLILLKILPLSLLSLPSFGAGSLWGRIFHPLIRSRGFFSKFLLGMATGFLPCLLSWAMIVKAATTSHPIGGFLIMAFFGAGTVPAMLFGGLSVSLLSLRLRFLGERIAAASVICMGLILIFKGTKYFA
jgi:sulfite exporter TauE/SafE